MRSCFRPGQSPQTLNLKVEYSKFEYVLPVTVTRNVHLPGAKPDVSWNRTKSLVADRYVIATSPVVGLFVLRSTPGAQKSTRASVGGGSSGRLVSGSVAETTI